MTGSSSTGGAAGGASDTSEGSTCTGTVGAAVTRLEVVTGSDRVASTHPAPEEAVPDASGAEPSSGREPAASADGSETHEPVVPGPAISGSAIWGAAQPKSDRSRAMSVSAAASRRIWRYMFEDLMQMPPVVEYG